MKELFDYVAKLLKQHGSVRAVARETGLARQTVMDLRDRKVRDYAPETLERLGFEYR